MSAGFYSVKCPLFYLILKCSEREQSRRRFSEIATGLIPVSSHPVFSDLCVWYSHWSMDGINTYVMIQPAVLLCGGLSCYIIGCPSHGCASCRASGSLPHRSHLRGSMRSHGRRPSRTPCRCVSHSHRARWHITDSSTRPELPPRRSACDRPL